MKLNKIIFPLAAAMGVVMCSCNDEVEMRRPPVPVVPDMPELDGNIHVFKAPLYWSVYEYCYEKELNTDSAINLTTEQWDEIIDWVAENLAPHGYDMICTDGFCAMVSEESHGYMTKYGTVPLRYLIAKCKSKGLKLGVYDNPLWLHGADETKIEGTPYTFADLKYNKDTDEVMHPKDKDQWFRWIVASHPGAKEYIDGFFKHYKSLGVEFIRMDFLSWYEDGWDRGFNSVMGYGYGRDTYALALSYIAESAQKYGIFTSLVMPHMYNDGIVEATYGNMTRIVCDTGGGGWWHFSQNCANIAFRNWPNCMNMFDGFVYWSHLSGRDKIILDGDFTRLNKFSTDAECESVISLQLMAGGPISVSDQPSTIGDKLRFYINDEMLALNKDRFVGKPLTDKLGDTRNQIWYGTMSDGSTVLGIFNRGDNAETKSVDFSEIGLTGNYKVRDLWSHTDEGEASSITANIPAHGCKIVKLTR